MGAYSAVARVVVVSLFGGLSGQAAGAATLTVLAGEVLLSRGEGYQAVSGQMEVELTDCLLVNPGGSAKIAYDDGATVEVGPGSTTCVGSALADPSGQGGSGTITGAAGNDAMSRSAARTSGAMGPESFDGGLFVVGGAAIVSGIGLVSAVHNDRHVTPPASP